MLDEFEKAKMLFRWVVDGKTYGFFIGSQKVHRLPYPSDRMKYAAPWNTGMLPEVELAQYLGFSVERVREEYGDLLSTYSRLTLDLLSTKSSTGNGNGSGVGVESGVGNGYEKGNENGNGNGAGAASEGGNSVHRASALTVLGRVLHCGIADAQLGWLQAA
jgi:hypothetical protein